MNEDVDLPALISEVEEDLYALIYDELNIPESITPRDIAAHFFSVLASECVGGRENPESDIEEFEVQRAAFDLVCGAVPNVPVRCLQVISMALGAIATCYNEDGRFREGNDVEAIRTLLTVSYACGIAKTHFLLEREKSSLLPRAILSNPDPVFRKRKHHIHHAINVAKRRSSDLNDSGSVWAELTIMAKDKSHALLGVTPKGIQYLDANDQPKEFSEKQLVAYLEGTNLNRKRPRKSA